MKPLNLYQHLAASIADHVSIVDLDYVYRLVNDAYLHAHGKPREAIEGHTVAELHGQATFETLIRPRLDRCFAGEVVRYEDWFDFPTQGRRYMSVIYSPYVNDDGDVVGAIVSGRDSTDQHQAREALRASEASYRNLFENMLHGYAYCRLLYEHGRAVDYLFLLVNRAFESLTGLKDVVGRKVSEVIPGFPDSNLELFDIYDRVAQSGEPEKFETYVPGLDRWFSASVYCPQPEHVIIIFDNVTGSRRIQRALEEQRERIHLLLDSMAEGMYGVDLEGVCTFVNKAGLRMLGYESPDQIVGHGIHELIHHHHADGSPYPAETCRVYKAYRHNQGIHIDDEVFWRRDGSAFPVEYWSYPLRQHGRVIGSVVTFLDVTERRQAESRLFEATQMLKVVIDTVPHYVFWKDRQFRYLGANRAFARLAGLDDPDELIGRDDYQFNWRAYAHLYQADDAQVMDSETAKHNIIEPMDQGDGRPRWLETSKEPLRDAEGKVIGVLGMFRDVTERIQAEERLRQAAKVFESTMEGVMITDLKGTIIAINQAFTDITGYTEAEALGNTPRLLRSSRHDESFYRAVWQDIAKTGLWQGEIWNRRKSGEIFPEWLTINTVYDQAGRPSNYVGVFSDISVVKQTEAKLNFLAYHDPLTELPNRQLFNDRLEHAIQRAKREDSRLAVLFIDLDQFKTVNDSLGHPIGDRLLCLAASVLSEAVRAEDTVARLGGDEFVILLEGLDDIGYAGDVARKIQEMLVKPHVLEGHTLVVGASIGISTYPADGDNATALLRNADSAMYRAKGEGRNTFRYYSAELTASARERLTLESELRRAIVHGDFELHYQPQLDVTNGCIIGAEALVRWRHPESGLISPLRFIPLAEETGQILPLGEWVLRTACAQYQAWQQEGLPPFTLAVNLSPRQFKQRKLVEQIGAILDATGMPARHLELEITEGAIMERGEQARAILLALKSLGIKLAIDDFGTGYSSLAYLRRFPINVLKIDQSFMHDIPHDISAMEIAATIIAMARNLNLKVLAEGVETGEQLAFLMARGCDYSQGYLHSRPLPANEFAALLRHPPVM